MSWQREATTHSSSAPARSARVAVCRQWVSWSTANPSTTSASDSSMASTASAVRPWCRRGLGADHRPLVVGRDIHAGERSRHGEHSRAVQPPRHPDPQPAIRSSTSAAAVARSAASTCAAGSPSAGPAPGVPPGAPLRRARAASRPRSSSRSSGGGGKYSSSTVTGGADRAEPRRQSLHHRLDQGLGGRGAGGDPDGARQVVGQLGGVVDPDHPRAAEGSRHLLEGDGVGGVLRADDHDGVGFAGQRP